MFHLQWFSIRFQLKSIYHKFSSKYLVFLILKKKDNKYTYWCCFLRFRDHVMLSKDDVNHENCYSSFGLKSFIILNKLREKSCCYDIMFHFLFQLDLRDKTVLGDCCYIENIDRLWSKPPKSICNDMLL